MDLLTPTELKSAKELHRRAWTLVQPFFQQAQQEAAARYRELVHTPQASQDIRQIVLAAYDGKVDALFAAIGYQQWGRYEPDTPTVHLHLEAQPGDEDLLDTAAVQTFLHGGSVYIVPLENTPGQVPLAAIFRF